MYKIILNLNWYTIYQLLMSIPSLDISISFTFFLSFYLLMFAFCKVSTNNIKSKNFALPPDVLCTKVHTKLTIYICVGYFSKVIFGENLVASMLCRWLVLCICSIADHDDQCTMQCISQVWRKKNWCHVILR